jgi:hypothetical protein
MVCFRHKINKERTETDTRLASIFSKIPTHNVEDYTVFADPPVTPGSDKILNEYKSGSEKTHLPVSSLQDFNINETISQMEKQLAAAINKGHQILQAAKGINLSHKRELLQKTDWASK